MPERFKSGPAPATNVPKLPTTKDSAKVSGIHAAILLVRHSLKASRRKLRVDVAHRLRDAADAETVGWTR
jgi:hypothetical protein